MYEIEHRKSREQESGSGIGRLMIYTLHHHHQERNSYGCHYSIQDTVIYPVIMLIKEIHQDPDEIYVPEGEYGETCLYRIIRVDHKAEPKQRAESVIYHDHNKPQIGG